MLFTLLVIPSILFAQQTETELRIHSGTDKATAGYFQLTWQGGNQFYIVQQSATDDFSNANVVYEGKDVATSMTGLSDGDYYFRVGTKFKNAATTSWSQPIKVSVLHHSLSRALWFFVMGAIVFMSILVAIYRGNKKYHKV